MNRKNIAVNEIKIVFYVTLVYDGYRNGETHETT